MRVWIVVLMRRFWNEINRIAFPFISSAMIVTIFVLIDEGILDSETVKTCFAAIVVLVMTAAIIGLAGYLTREFYVWSINKYAEIKEEVDIERMSISENFSKQKKEIINEH